MSMLLFGSSVLEFGFYSGKIESGKNQTGFKSGLIRFGFGLSMFGSLWVGSLRIGFELDQIIFGCGFVGDKKFNVKSGGAMWKMKYFLFHPILLRHVSN